MFGRDLTRARENISVYIHLLRLPLQKSFKRKRSAWLLVVKSNTEVSRASKKWSKQFFWAVRFSNMYVFIPPTTKWWNKNRMFSGGVLVLWPWNLFQRIHALQKIFCAKNVYLCCFLALKHPITLWITSDARNFLSTLLWCSCNWWVLKVVLPTSDSK